MRFMRKDFNAVCFNYLLFLTGLNFICIHLNKKEFFYFSFLSHAVDWGQCLAFQTWQHPMRIHEGFGGAGLDPAYMTNDTSSSLLDLSSLSAFAHAVPSFGIFTPVYLESSCSSFWSAFHNTDPLPSLQVLPLGNIQWWANIYVTLTSVNKTT